MLRRTIQLCILIILLPAPLPLWAHDAFRIIGNVTKWQDSTLNVKDKSGYVWSIKVRDDTLVVRASHPEGPSQLHRDDVRLGNQG